MNEPQLRRATAADADKLTALARSAYARHVPVIGREPLPMTADWAKLLCEQEIWILEGPAGEAVASLALDVQADHVLVWSVAVAPAHQQRGLGRRLMAFAEERASALQRRNCGCSRTRAWPKISRSIVGSAIARRCAKNCPTVWSCI